MCASCTFKSCTAHHQKTKTLSREGFCFYARASSLLLFIHTIEVPSFSYIAIQYLPRSWEVPIEVLPVKNSHNLNQIPFHLQPNPVFTKPDSESILLCLSDFRPATSKSDSLSGRVSKTSSLIRPYTSVFLSLCKSLRNNFL